MNAAARMLPIAVLLACSLLLDRAVRLEEDCLRPDLVLTIEGLPELSGVVAAPAGGTLFAVSDEGVIAQIDQRGRILRRASFPGRDLEAVTWNVTGDRLLVLDERSSTILTTDPESFETAGTIGLPPPRAGPVAGLGYEGLSAQPGYLLLLRQADPCALLRVAPDGRALMGEFPLDTEEASDLMPLADAGGCVVLSPTRGLRLYLEDGRPGGPWVPVLGHHVEGVTLLAGFGLVFVTDETPSRMLVVTELRDPQALRARLQPQGY